jgi:hypothetical protein
MSGIAVRALWISSPDAQALKCIRASPLPGGMVSPPGPARSAQADRAHNNSAARPAGFNPFFFVFMAVSLIGNGKWQFF